MKIRVSNINRITTEEDLFSLFEEFGDVIEVVLNEDPDDGEFTFSASVEMEFEEDGLEAIKELNGELVDGEILYVRTEAKAVQEHKRRFELDEFEDDDLLGQGSEKFLSKKGLREPEQALRRKPPRRKR